MKCLPSSNRHELETIGQAASSRLESRMLILSVKSLILKGQPLDVLIVDPRRKWAELRQRFLGRESIGDSSIKNGIFRISPQNPFQLYLIFSSGYALHQPLRSAPYDMYVTNLRLRLPHHKAGYIHIDKCRYDTLHKLLQTNLLFRDLSITGNIQLVSDTLGKKLLDESQTSTERYPDLGID